MNIGTYLDRNVARYEDRPLLFYYDLTLSYREFGEKVNALANGLQGLGFKQGDFIHVWVLNSPETLISFFAIQKIGAIAGPINGSWKADEVEYLLNDSQGRGLIVGDQYLPSLDEIRGRCSHLETIVAVGGDSRRQHVPFETLLAESSSDLIECPAAEVDPAYIFYTSGTTGNPKGVLLSHRNVLADIKCFQDALRLDEGYRILIFLPLFHVNAMLTSTSALDKGGAVILRKQFSASEFWPVVEKYRPNFFSAVPAVYSILLTDPGRDQYDKSSLEFGICGAAPMPVETFRELGRGQKDRQHRGGLSRTGRSHRR
jgi:acyl-CoA synthetase (AMP-forming)/AMP-acid ligase II